MDGHKQRDSCARKLEFSDRELNTSQFWGLESRKHFVDGHMEGASKRRFHTASISNPHSIFLGSHVHNLILVHTFRCTWLVCLFLDTTFVSYDHMTTLCQFQCHIGNSGYISLNTRGHSQELLCSSLCNDPSWVLGNKVIFFHVHMANALRLSSRIWNKRNRPGQGYIQFPVHDHSWAF